MNYRGQEIENINNNYFINIKYEDIFKNHIEKLLNIQLDKMNDRYMHYDFKYNKNIIEYKGIYYRLDENENLAFSKDKNKNPLNSVIIGEDKIKYYKQMKNKNNDLKFYLFYGFYNIDTETELIKEIIYKYIDISNILNIILTEYFKFDYYNKTHLQIPIKSLLTVDKDLLLLFNN